MIIFVPTLARGIPENFVNMTVLLLVIAFLSLFFSSLVFLKKNKSFPDYLLGSWFIFMALHMVILYVQMYNAHNNYPYPEIIGMDISLVAVHPIWIFLYILAFIQPGKNRYSMLWHLIPLAVLNLVLLFTFYTRSNEEKIRSYDFALHGTGFIDKSLELTVLLVISISLGYLIASYLVLRKHLKNVKNQYSNLEGVDLRWLRVLLYSIAIVFIINTILDLTRNYSGMLPNETSVYFGYVSILAGISYVGIHGIRQTSFFINEINGGSEVFGNNKPGDEISGKIDTGIPTDRDLDDNFGLLVRYMEDEKPYLEFDLNLPGLAQQLGFRPHYLSQLINQETGKNFFDFINQYRVNEFKTRVRQPGNQVYTLISLAYDCGFNSKATFNRVFKNLTGHTPSAYLRNKELH